jgi:hypothetical protein
VFPKKLYLSDSRTRGREPRFPGNAPCGACTSLLRELRKHHTTTATVIAILLLRAIPAFGHHSIASYDLVHGTVLEGLVTGFVWENPHAHIYLDLAAENQVERWTIELESPKVLQSLGWNKDTLKKGDRISVTGGRAKNGSLELRAAYIQMPDGRKLLALKPPEN